MAIKQCVVCDRKFETQGKTILCSDECWRARTSERARRYRKDNPEKIRSQARSIYARNSEKIRAQAREHYKRSRERNPHKSRKRPMTERDREYQKEYEAKRRRALRVLETLGVEL